MGKLFPPRMSEAKIEKVSCGPTLRKKCDHIKEQIKVLKQHDSVRWEKENKLLLMKACEDMERSKQNMKYS